ncbi:MAG: FAD-dependent oxidoreductase, partial [Pyrinomonadaceae bacterium]
EKNAKHAFEQRFRVLKPDMQQVLEQMQQALGLPQLPSRIESFDVSNISGAENVAGMVVCENGKINPVERRHFRIKTVEGSNDVASMREAVYRRYRRQVDEGKTLPDLVLIDGGKAQVAAAGDAMRELNLREIPMVGVVKPPRRHNEISHFIVKGREHEPVYLDSHSAVLRFIQMIRDETHRTAVAYHRKRREMRDFTSELTAIPGVGDKRKNRLLRNFGSIVRIANATSAELTPFVGRTTAEDIVARFTRQRELAGGGRGANEDDDGQDDGRSSESLSAVQAKAEEIDELPIIETRLDDPEGDAADLQPIRSVDHLGQLRERRPRRPRGERSTNPHGIKREKIGQETTDTAKRRMTRDQGFGENRFGLDGHSGRAATNQTDRGHARRCLHRRRGNLRAHGRLPARARGKSVVVLDDQPIGDAQSPRTTGHLANAIDDRYYEIERLHGEQGARLAAESHTAAIARIESIAREEKIDCDFERLDGYLFAPPGESADTLDKELAAAHRAGLTDVERVARAPIASFDTGAALRFPRQGQFHITKYLAGLTEVITRLGGRIFLTLTSRKSKAARKRAQRPPTAPPSQPAPSSSPPTRRSTTSCQFTPSRSLSHLCDRSARAGGFRHKGALLGHARSVSLRAPAKHAEH